LLSSGDSKRFFFHPKKPAAASVGKEKNNKNCLTRDFAKRPSGALVVSFITSRNYMKNMRKFFQRKDAASRRGLPAKGRDPAWRNALCYATKV
jgi:hypothetical protein